MSEAPFEEGATLELEGDGSAEARIWAIEALFTTALTGLAGALSELGLLVAAGSVSAATSTQIRSAMGTALERALRDATHALATEPAAVSESEMAELGELQSLQDATVELQARIDAGEEFERVDEVMEMLAEKLGFALS